MTVTNIIEEKIQQELNPHFFELKNISHLHEGHAGHDGSGESHFILIVVAEAFNGMSKIKRHRRVYDVLQAELKERVHALSIKAYTPDEYERS